MSPPADKMLQQVTELTLITPIRQGFVPSPAGASAPPIRYVDRLRGVLEAVQQRVANRVPTPLDAVGRVHFARWVIFDNDQRLLFTSNYDGPFDGYLREFSALIAEELDLVWGNCEDYPGAAHYDAFFAWVRRHQVPTTCFYAATPDLTLRDIQQLRDFKRRHDAFLAALEAAPGNLTALFSKLMQEVRPTDPDVRPPGQSDGRRDTQDAA